MCVIWGALFAKYVLVRQKLLIYYFYWLFIVVKEVCYLIFKLKLSSFYSTQ